MPALQNLKPWATTEGALTNARRWAIVTLLFVASLINYLDRATISVALPRLAHDLALSPIIKGVLLSSFFWSYALMQVPIGWCVDRFNLRWLYAGSFALWSLACGLTGLAGSLLALILLRVLLGVGESIFLPGGLKIVSRISQRRSGACQQEFLNPGADSGLPWAPHSWPGSSCATAGEACFSWWVS